MPKNSEYVVLGVDTHKEFHHAAVITVLGEQVADARFPATGDGYAALIDWAGSHGPILRAGVEGTGSYGAGLTAALTAAGIEVVDVIAPDKQERRLRGKTDQIDAYSAARAVLARRATTIPKTRDGHVEAIRVLHTARRLLVKQATEMMNQLHGFLVSAPEALRATLTGLKGKKLAQACARTRDSRHDDIVTATTKTTLRMLARHWLELQTQTDQLRAQLKTLIGAYAPELLAVFGIGPDIAASLLTVTGQNPDRIGSESALAHLTGTAPIPASSGKTSRHRLNRGGNRQGNAAFHRIVIVRMKYHEPTRRYVQKTLARGKSKLDAIRLLKRYLAREIYPILTAIQHRHETAQNAA